MISQRVLSFRFTLTRGTRYTISLTEQILRHSQGRLDQLLGRLVRRAQTPFSDAERNKMAIVGPSPLPRAWRLGLGLRLRIRES